MRRFLWIIGVLMVCSWWGLGAVVRTETFQLNSGWNAIYLSVDPLNSDPAAVFSDSSIDVVASFRASGSFGQFSTDLTVDKLRLLGWGIWYAPARDDSFLSTLWAIHGQTPYLVHATEAGSFAVRGAAMAAQRTWRSNAFNLVGFAVDPAAPPRFDQFFSASPAHRNQPIYRMVDGIWVRVQNPNATLMRSGEAFWVYCDGASDFSGPLAISGIEHGGLSLQSLEKDLVLRNDAPYPLSSVLEQVVEGENTVPLAVMVQVVGEKSQRVQSIPVPMGRGAWRQELPVLEPGESIRIPFKMQAADSSVGPVESLLCIRTDVGTETWIPVRGIQEELK